MANWANSITIEGLPAVMAKLAVTDSAIIEKTALALGEGGEVIAARARANAADHRWTGRVEASVQVRPRGPLTVVVRSSVPGGSPLEHGWLSAAGRQPPSGPRSRLVKWLGEKGVAEPRRLAFVVARQIAKRGYSFPPTHWMSRAAHDAGGEVLTAVAAAGRVL